MTIAAHTHAMMIAQVGALYAELSGTAIVASILYIYRTVLRCLMRRSAKPPS